MDRDTTFTIGSRVEPVEDRCAEFVMDEDTFRAFYERTARGVWAYLARVTGDRQLADDLFAGNTFYRFLRANATHETESHRRNSLYRIATNLARDARRQSLTRPAPVLAGDSIESAPSTSQSGAAEQSAGFQPRDVESPAAGTRDALAGLCRGRLASRDRHCARSESRQPEDHALFRARHKLAALLSGAPDGRKP